MSTLTVLLPPRDVRGPDSAQWPVMPFALFDRKGQLLQSGQGDLAKLTKANATVLVVAARDTLLLNVTLPPVTGPKLQRLLPNVVEEHLIQDAQRSHIAVDPLPLASGERCVAVLDREGFAGVLSQLSAAGHQGLRAVPLLRCVPLQSSEGISQSADADLSTLGSASRTGSEAQTLAAAAAFPGEGEESIAAVVEPGAPTEESGADRAITHATSVLIVRGTPSASRGAAGAEEGAGTVELAVRQGMLGFGMSVDATQLDATVGGIAAGELCAVYDLQVGADKDGEPSMARTSSANGSTGAATMLPWADVARQAMSCNFDLCQFGVAGAGRQSWGAGGIKPWRVAIGLVTASLLVSIVAVNVQWLQQRHRRDALNAQMAQVVKASFPEMTVILDPHEQMAAKLARMRRDSGELRPDDYLALAAGLAHALGPVSSASIATLNYSGGVLDVTFKPGTNVDEDGLRRRLAANGLSADEDNGKWTLKPAKSLPR